MIYIGIDNGVTGSIGIIKNNGEYDLYPTPTIRQLNYQKTKVRYLNRVNVELLLDVLKNEIQNDNAKVLIERPMVNPKRFQATVSALRALESTIVILEILKLSYSYCDSKAWQKSLLPNFTKTSNLKELSLEVGKREYPNIDWSMFKDADGILIAQYCKNLFKD